MLLTSRKQEQNEKEKVMNELREVEDTQLIIWIESTRHQIICLKNAFTVSIKYS